MRRELHVRFCEGGGVQFPSATRLVILCRATAAQVHAVVAEQLQALGLTLSATKTRLLDARQQAFTFLGFTVGSCGANGPGGPFP